MDDELEAPFPPRVLLAVFGGIAGAFVPLAYGVHALQALQQPLPPGVGGCGLMPLGAILLTLFGPPIVAPMIALAGYSFGWAWELRRFREQEERDE